MLPEPSDPRFARIPDETDLAEICRFYRMQHEHYDSDNLFLRGSADMEFYRRAARRVGGPVLELGCGTGRVGLPLINDGHEYVGLDLSVELLQQFSSKLARTGRERAGQATLTQADMRRLDLARTFPLIICPFRAFQHLLTLAEQQSLLEAIRRHLTPNGRLIFDLFAPNYALLAQRPARRLSIERGDARVGKIQRFDTVIPIYHRQVLRVETHWERRGDDRTLERLGMFTTHLRWIHRFELELLLERAGFQLLALHGDFDAAPFGDDSLEMVVETRLMAA